MNTNELKLIDGQFDRSSAREILLDLIDYKIKHHKIARFQSDIRYGKNLPEVEKRIEELSEDRIRMKEWLQSIPEDAVVEMFCNIQVMVKTKNGVSSTHQ